MDWDSEKKIDYVIYPLPKCKVYLENLTYCSHLPVAIYMYSTYLCDVLQ